MQLNALQHEVPKSKRGCLQLLQFGCVSLPICVLSLWSTITQFASSLPPYKDSVSVYTKTYVHEGETSTRATLKIIQQ